MKDEQEGLKRVEEQIINRFARERRPPTAGLSPDEFRRLTVFTIVNVLLTAPDAPRRLLKTRDARVRHLSERLQLEPTDAELLHDAFEACARMQPGNYPDVAMLIETAKRMASEPSMETPAGMIRHDSKTRH